MRTTQVIGLTAKASRLIKDAESRSVNPEMAVGMFDEPIAGSIWDMPNFSDNRGHIRYVEIVQVSPWSSGPMIFTCLMEQLVLKDGSVTDIGPCCQWVVDPLLSGLREFDYDAGTYYI